MSTHAISSLLIANRGEIASRIIRTCRKMGIRSIAVFSDADREAPYVSEADVAVYLGESEPSASYLDQDKVIAVAHKTHAQAIHPGYGFLSENASFARRCQEEGLVFIGPKPEAIEAMGSKSRAKELMKRWDVPIVPGYQGRDQSEERLSKAAISIGFPVLLKAAAGGGGKGMRIVKDQSELAPAIDAARREAQSAFGDEELIIEKYISSGRHIEFQIFGDKQGNVLHLLERECTLQRRYQKVIEESPSPIMDEKLRQGMGEAAIKAAKALSYDNAGTVEFILDSHSGDFYFLEVNTRLQVEHPVTEAITGLDLVEMQIEVAQGNPLQLKQEEVIGEGYAIECRLYAEDPEHDFLPVSGKLLQFAAPEVEGLRIESGVQSGSEISIFYDPMIAKLIVHDKNRRAAQRKMHYVLRQLQCMGLQTNQAFLLRVLEQEDFQKGVYDTHFISTHSDLTGIVEKTEPALRWAGMAACLFDWQRREEQRSLLASLPSGWRSSFYRGQQVSFSCGNQSMELNYRQIGKDFVFYWGEEEVHVKLGEPQSQCIELEVDGLRYSFAIRVAGGHYFLHNELLGGFHLEDVPRFPQPETGKREGGYEAPMPSQVIKVLVEEGQEVKAGESLLILSSMKMENTVSASADGQVADVFVTEGMNVEAGVVLLAIQPFQGNEE